MHFVFNYLTVKITIRKSIHGEDVAILIGKPIPEFIELAVYREFDTGLI
jgi:hypothetical protein